MKKVWKCGFVIHNAAQRCVAGVILNLVPGKNEKRPLLTAARSYTGFDFALITRTRLCVPLGWHTLF